MSGHEFVAAFDDASGIDVHDDRTNIGEDTIAELRQIMARYPEPRSALLPMLHLVQSVDGRVTDAGVQICADLLGISTAQVNGVATFYTMYKRRPAGHHHIGVCTTTVCAVMGGDILLDQMKERLGIDTITFGIAMPDEDVHAPNEFFRLSSLEEGLRAWPLLLTELGKVAPEELRGR